MRLLQRLIVATGSGPLGRVWALAYRALVRTLAAGVTRDEPETSVYVRGGLGTGDAVYGLSDVDMIVVAAPGKIAGESHARIRERYERLVRRVPALGRVAGHFFVFEEPALERAASASALTSGLATRPCADRAAYLADDPVPDELGLLERPGLYGPTADWRLVCGTEHRPPASPRTQQDERIAAWLELQSWWRLAFDAVLAPDRPHVPYLCVKLVAEPARILLWLERGERIARREDVLWRALGAMPEEEPALEQALALLGALPHSPTPPLAESLAALVRLSARIASLLAAEAGPSGETEVLLVGADDWPEPPPLAGLVAASPRLPLADWRACAIATRVTDELVLVEGSPAEPASVAAAAHVTGAQVGFLDGVLLVLPAAEIWERGKLRAVQCPPTDPVSFALAAGADRARFPNVAGWSVADLARRAAAEHRAWLASTRPLGRGTRPWHDLPPPPDEASARVLEALLATARAALLLASVEEGRPELCLTPAAIAAGLSARRPAARSVAEEAVSALGERLEPAPVLVRSLHRETAELLAYADRAPTASGRRPS